MIGFIVDMLSVIVDPCETLIDILRSRFPGTGVSRMPRE